MADDYVAKTQPKTVLLSRSSNVPKSRSSLYSVSSSVSRMSGSGFFDPSVYSKMSNAGISDFRGNREKEKREMQGLNERLASYIEKVRFLEAQNKRLEAENEALRSRKQEDWKPIRDMYEGELNQCRELLKQMSTEKGVNEGRLAGMQDEIRALKELINTYETQSKDYIKKIDQLNNQIGDYEGETATLRLRIASLEDEVGKYRDLLARLKEDNARLRADLDAETCAHIEHEVDAQAKAEEIEFLRDLLDKVQVQELPPVTVNGKDLEAFYKGEIARCVRDIQQEYDQQLSAMTMDIEAKYAAQMNQLRSGNARENFELAHSKEEVKRLKDELGKLKATIAELNAELSKTRSERDSYMAQLSELQLELDRERTENARRLDELNMQIEALMASLRELMDCKMSLELEISCYKKLLEGEENRTGLRQLVEQTIGTRGSGAASLADMIQQSSMSSSTGRLTIQRQAKGPCTIRSVEQSGSNIVIENTSSGARAKSQNLDGWSIEKEVNGKVTFKVALPDFELEPKGAFTIWAKGAKAVKSDKSEMIADFFSFGTGNGVFTLRDQTGQEKAQLTMRFVEQS